MRAGVALLCALAAANCLTLHQEQTKEPKADIQVPLKQVLIPSSLSDILVLTAPIVRNAQYYLTNPKGSTVKLNITPPTYNNDEFNSVYDNIVLKNENDNKVITKERVYRIVDLSPDSYGDDVKIEEVVKELNSNEFMIGPLLETDHGNWMLSLYYKNENGKWVEMYQVFHVEISAYVPPNPRFPTYNTGDTFEISFAYPIPGLESCELHAPKTSFDRFYERNMKVDMASCGYTIKNLTVADRGLWTLTGVGTIVYGTQLYLDVMPPNTTEANMLAAVRRVGGDALNILDSGDGYARRKDSRKAKQ